MTRHSDLNIYTQQWALCAGYVLTLTRGTPATFLLKPLKLKTVVCLLLGCFGHIQDFSSFCCSYWKCLVFLYFCSLKAHELYFQCELQQHPFWSNICSFWCLYSNKLTRLLLLVQTKRLTLHSKRESHRAVGQFAVKGKLRNEEGVSVSSAGVQVCWSCCCVGEGRAGGWQRNWCSDLDTISTGKKELRLRQTCWFTGQSTFLCLSVAISCVTTGCGNNEIMEKIFQKQRKRLKMSCMWGRTRGRFSFKQF